MFGALPIIALNVYAVIDDKLEEKKKKEQEQKKKRTRRKGSEQRLDVSAERTERTRRGLLLLSRLSSTKKLIN